jgi:hypothetical protein
MTRPIKSLETKPVPTVSVEIGSLIPSNLSVPSSRLVILYTADRISQV